MDIKIQAGELLALPSDLAVLALCEGAPLPAAVADLLEAADFGGKTGQTALIYPRGVAAPRRLLLLGLGEQAKVDAEALRSVAAEAVRRARELQVAHFTLGVAGDLPVDASVAGQALAEGLVLGAYRYWRYRTGLSAEQTFSVEAVTLMAAADVDALAAGAAVGQKIAGGVVLARDLVNGPGSVVTPAALADQAVELGQRLGFAVTVLDKAQLIEGGFGGILAVGQGSANEPRFILMEYGAPAPGTKTICLVGKGITFDSGGLSLKPADAMETMKGDMGGAAAVLGTMQVVAELKLPLHVVGLVAAAENMPSATAYRPGDVLKTLSGKTIEVLNTDAEGRIVLADALFYAQRFNPAAIVELSTLTGAVVVALGPHATGMMGTDEALMDKLRAAGETSGERVWPLPLWQAYHDMIKSEIADVKNIGGRAAGAMTAGAFLAAFTGSFPFAHLDIAGTAWVDKPSKPTEVWGGTGVGVRLLAEFLRTDGA